MAQSIDISAYESDGILVGLAKDAERERLEILLKGGNYQLNDEPAIRVAQAMIDKYRQTQQGGGGGQARRRGGFNPVSGVATVGMGNTAYALAVQAGWEPPVWVTVGVAVSNFGAAVYAWVRS